MFEALLEFLAGGGTELPTHPPEFAVGDQVFAFINQGKTFTTVSKLWWDEAMGDWFYCLAGLQDIEFAAYEVYAVIEFEIDDI